jgi:phospholipid/cholesterol/gamma-HCH transport system permease protein
MTAQASLNHTLDGDVLQYTATGSWTVPQALALNAAVDAAIRAPVSARRAIINIAGVRELDTFGAWLLERLLRHAGGDGREARFGEVPERYRTLLEELSVVNRRPPAAPRGGNPVTNGLEWLGRRAIEIGRDLVSLLVMFGALGEALLRAIMSPRSFRYSSMVNQLDRVSWQAVPIIALITLLIGAIIAQQGFFHFRKFGADDYVVDLVGILVLREIGVLLVAIMVAGRSGASYTAELGSMKMREEVDALRTMGLNPIEVLVLPRVLALVIALPILTFIGSMVALYGGGLVAWLYGGMSPSMYIERLHDAVSLDHFKVGMIKAPFMALLIGAVASIEGLSVKGSAESLGLHTTSSVVKSIFFVIVLDGIFAVFFASIGM